MSGEKKPVPFIIHVRATYTGYGDSRRPVAELLLSDGSRLTLENDGGEGYTGNTAGPELLTALKRVGCAARAAFLKALSEAEGAKASNGGEEAMKPIYIWRGILKRPHGETWQVIRYSSDKNAAIKAASKLDQVVERVLPGKTGHAKIIWP